MLLIGSRAGKIHFPDYRQPHDYDFIASREEAHKFLENFEHNIEPSHPKKIRAKVKLPRRAKTFEIEIAEEIPSSAALVDLNKNNFYEDKELRYSYNVASPETLFLLKKSHIPFNIHWKKNIVDYLYLKSRIDNSKLDDKWNDIFQTRFEEVKERMKHKERNFNVSNSEFFKVSERFVQRIIPHDNIHYATCFFDEPLFRKVKDDLGKAEMSESKVNALSNDLKIKLIQEEIMALSIERVILPAIKENKTYDARSAYIDTASKMVYNYLPMYLRFFAADNFLEITNLGFDYVDKFLKNVKDLDLNLKNNQRNYEYF